MLSRTHVKSFEVGTTVWAAYITFQETWSFIDDFMEDESFNDPSHETLRVYLIFMSVSVMFIEG